MYPSPPDPVDEQRRYDSFKLWRIETDWTVEVVAGDGTAVAKFQTRKEAEAFIADAQRRYERGKSHAHRYRPPTEMSESYLAGYREGVKTRKVIVRF